MLKRFRNEENLATGPYYLFPSSPENFEFKIVSILSSNVEHRDKEPVGAQPAGDDAQKAFRREAWLKTLRTLRDQNSAIAQGIEDRSERDHASGGALGENRGNDLLVFFGLE